MSHAHEINGELLKLRREERGWAQSDMATRACMSVKQIRQLEEGGVSAFYSESVKVAAAKKVAGILGLSVDQVWIAPESHSEPEPVQDTATHTEHEEHPAQHEPVHTDGDHVEHDTHADKQPEVHVHQVAAPEVEAKPKTSLWLIAGLFGAALAVAAYMRPEAEPVATEPPPPLQAVPSEAAEPASGASAAVEASSSPASDAVTPKTVASAPVVTTAASASSSASKPAVAASAVASAAKPLVAASASAAVRPASATVVAPAASAASK